MLKQGRFAKRNFHKRHVHHSSGSHTLKLYKDDKVSRGTPKQTIDLRGKVVRARASKAVDTNACVPYCTNLVKRFFVQIIDPASDKVVAMFEVENETAAAEVVQRLKKHTS